ncbi:hypothetical protein GCM10022205_11260 [Spinactinospora alkalitolerans]
MGNLLDSFAVRCVLSADPALRRSAREGRTAEGGVGLAARAEAEGGVEECGGERDRGGGEALPSGFDLHGGFPARERC